MCATTVKKKCIMELNNCLLSNRTCWTLWRQQSINYLENNEFNTSVSECMIVCLQIWNVTKQYLLFDPLNLEGLDFLGILCHPVKKKKGLFIFVCSFLSFNPFNLSVNWWRLVVCSVSYFSSVTAWNSSGSRCAILSWDALSVKNSTHNLITINI